MKTELLRFRDVSARDESGLTVEHIDLSICQRELISVISADDVAKQVFLNLVVCKTEAMSGERFIARRNQTDTFGYIANDRRLFENMSVTDNLLWLCDTPAVFTGSRAAGNSKAQALLNRYHLNISAGVPVKKLSVAEKCLVEIVKAIEIYHVQIIVINNFQDIPLESVPLILRAVELFRKNGGAVVLASIARLPSLVNPDATVMLQYGCPVRTSFGFDSKLTKSYGEVSFSPLMQIGNRSPDIPKNIVTERFDIRYKTKHHASSFYVHSGQILGFYSQYSFSDDDVLALAQSGQLFISSNGKPIEFKGVASLLDQRIGFLPLRFESMILTNMDLKNNVELMSYRNLCRFPGILSPKLEAYFVKNCVSVESDSIPKVDMKNISSSSALRIITSRYAQKRWRLLLVHVSTFTVDSLDYRILGDFITSLSMRGVAIVLISSNKHWLEYFCRATVTADPTDQAGESAL